LLIKNQHKSRYSKQDFLTIFKMSAKTIFIIIISVLVTIILMNNTDDVNFWLFGETTVPKLAVFGVMFFAGGIVGFMLGRPRKKLADDELEHPSAEPVEGDYLSDEDREYIS
jgi:uncharacterized integral membrane protein